MKNAITIESTLSAPIAKAWDHWNDPESIKQWYHASADWHTTESKVSLRKGGKFLTRMEAKDGSSGFEMTGKYISIKKYVYINYEMDDKRNVSITFESIDPLTTKIIQSFEPEDENPREIQRQGWQNILDNFKKFVELR